MQNLKEQICLHVNKSLENNQYNQELSFCIPNETIRRIKGILHFDMSEYTCIIKSNEIRHVKRRHPSDINFICEIPEIIQHFYKVRKSITRDRKTGASLISLEFYKKYNDKSIKLVKLKIYKDKRLELKTVFIEEQ